MNKNDTVVNSFGNLLVVVQAGSVVTAVRTLGRPTSEFTWYPTASLNLYHTWDGRNLTTADRASIARAKALVLA